MADVGTLPASGTQNRQESSLRGNLSHRVQTSVRSVPKDPFLAKCRTVLDSHLHNQGMDTLRLGDLALDSVLTPRQDLVTARVRELVDRSRDPRTASGFSDAADDHRGFSPR